MRLDTADQQIVHTSGREILKLGIALPTTKHRLVRDPVGLGFDLHRQRLDRRAEATWILFSPADFHPQRRRSVKQTINIPNDSLIARNQWDQFFLNVDHDQR